MSWLEQLSLWVYSILMRLLCPWVKLRLARRAHTQPLLASQVQERFGYYDFTPLLTNPVGSCVWVHAVSLGETRAAGLVMAALRQANPHIRFLLTHGSATGREEGARLLGEQDLQVWQPWDTPASVERFIDHFKPKLALMMETEVWPLWVQTCLSRGIPMCLINARLSEKSFHAALRLAWLARPAYRGLSAVWAQTDEDAQRLSALGAKVRGILGNVKFDAHPNKDQASLGHAVRHVPSLLQVLLASAREGEELMFLQSILALPFEQRRGVNFLVVPRHPERFEEVAQSIVAHGFDLVRRSSFDTLEAFAKAIQMSRDCQDCSHQGTALARQNVSEAIGMGGSRQGQIFLGDSMGEMNFYYACAHVALMGASFKPLGGQNLIEAIANECPVVLGPHTFNFQDIASMALQAGVARSSPTMATGLEDALEWARHPKDWNDSTQRCSAFIQTHQGASKALAKALAEYL
jgi:3-deoxy-D-manno-octulosonic-acid transferase